MHSAFAPSSAENPTPAAPRRGGAGTTRRAFWRVLPRVAMVAAAVHGLFVALFAWLDVWPMVAVNVVSIALYLAAARLLRQRRNTVATRLIVAEVLLHAALAVVLVGWDSGFHYYLVCLVPPTLIGVAGRGRGRLARLASLTLLYLALDAWSGRVAPLYAVAEHALVPMRWANIAACFAILSFLSASYRRTVDEAEHALRELAATDPLTGLHNRRRLLEMARREHARHGRSRHPVCVLLCDVDHFKAVNDTHGHDAGDRVLRHVAQLLAETVRTNDAVGRWGGEEFLALLPDTELTAAAQVAQRMRLAVADAVFDGATPLRLSVTIGVASLRPGESVERFIARADAGLYRGKVAGRNRVEVERAGD